MNKEFSKIIPSDVRVILRWLHSYQAYIIGGACRDFLSKKEPKDFDIVTSATPDEICNRFKSAVSVGNNFLVTLVKGIEVATYRKDKKDYAEVAHTLEEDVARRDFTINAIAYDYWSNKFIDCVGGIDDLENKVLRFIGNPTDRIIEDPIRILRGIRFASQLNLTIETESFFAMVVNKDLLNNIPGERIRQEIIKAFSGENSFRFLTMLEEMGMLDYVFPSLHKLRGVNGGGYHNETVLEHCFYGVKAIDKTKNYLLKLAILYHDIGKQEWEYNDKNLPTFKGHNMRGRDDIRFDLGSCLKFTNKEVDYVCTMSKLHMDCIDSKRSIRRLNVKLVEADIPIKEFCLLRHADNKGNILKKSDFMEIWSKYRQCLSVLNEKMPFNLKSLDITGNDLMQEFNMEPSKAIGDMLNSAFEAVINETIQNNKEDIISFLKEVSNEK
jgi:tRNA nucleotidyltransferase/poly(A) polymerase